MNANIEMSLDRADELLADLQREHDRSLKAHEVSSRAIHYTHEIAERLRSVLDRLARLYWERHVAPVIGAKEAEKATVYFPISKDEQAFNSTLGRWKCDFAQGQNDLIKRYMLSLQPFSNSINKWIATLHELAVQSKHIDLIPQKRTEQKRIVVRDAHGGSVSWDPGSVSFGAGVWIAGAPVNPSTQRIMPTAGVTETIEVWVDFMIDGYGVSARAFCRAACVEVRKIAERMTEKFALN